MWYRTSYLAQKSLMLFLVRLKDFSCLQNHTSIALEVNLSSPLSNHPPPLISIPKIQETERRLCMLSVSISMGLLLLSEPGTHVQEGNGNRSGTIASGKIVAFVHATLYSANLQVTKSIPLNLNLKLLLIAWPVNNLIYLQLLASLIQEDCRFKASLGNSVSPCLKMLRIEFNGRVLA